MTLSARFVLLPALLACLLLSGCSSAYYGTMEAFGKHKRDILVDRVKDANNQQIEAKEQFKDALTRFKEVVGTPGAPPSKLEDRYNTLKREYDISESKAQGVSTRIDAIKDVAKALFSEWEDELAQYQSAELRTSSEGQLRQTQARYLHLIGAMERAEGKMDKVLASFKDQVLFLKHNLNAQAIASLDGVTLDLQNDVAALIREMEVSIEEANKFIKTMKSDA